MAASCQGVNEILERYKTRRSGNQSLRVQNFQENFLTERTWPDDDASSAQSLQRWHMLTNKATLNQKLCHLISSNADIALTVSASITHDSIAGGQSKKQWQPWALKWTDAKKWFEFQTQALTARMGDCTVPGDFGRKRTELLATGEMILVGNPAMLKVALIFGSISSL